jgi:hypothetical protein
LSFSEFSTENAEKIHRAHREPNREGKEWPLVRN